MYTLVDKWLDEGRAKGREEGREEGAQISLRAALEQMLAKRFGAVPETVTQAIRNADLDALNEWLLNFATANTLAEVGIEASGASRQEPQ